MKHTGRLFARGCILSVASLVVLLLSWFAYSLISDGLSARMMTFEQEPAEGWNYWRWFFIKRSLGGILITICILATLAGVVLWGWIAFLRNIARGRSESRS